MKTNVKFVRVSDGLYRDYEGWHIIMKDVTGKQVWRVYWTTWLNSVRVHEEFRTLNTAKQFVREKRMI